MKRVPFVLVAGVILAACSPEYRNGAVRPTVPETLVGAHADPNAKATAKPAAKSDAKPTAAPSGDR